MIRSSALQGSNAQGLVGHSAPAACAPPNLGHLEGLRPTSYYAHNHIYCYYPTTGPLTTAMVRLRPDCPVSA